MNKSLETSWDDEPLNDVEMGAIFEVDFVNNDCPRLEVVWSEQSVDFAKIEDYKFFGDLTFALEKNNEECVCFKNYWYVVSDDKSPFEVAMECGDIDHIYTLNNELQNTQSYIDLLNEQHTRTIESVRKQVDELSTICLVISSVVISSAVCNWFSF